MSVAGDVQIARRRVGKSSLIGGSVLAALATSAGLALAATPVSGSISGQVTSVKGSSFVVKDAFGPVAASTVSVTGSSAIIEQVAASTPTSRSAFA